MAFRLALLALLLFFVAVDKSQALATKHSLKIKSEQAEIDYRQHTVLFSGSVIISYKNSVISAKKALLTKDKTIVISDRVRAKFANYHISCELLTYRQNRLIAEGNVKINENEIKVASGNRVVYLINEERILIEGNNKSKVKVNIEM